jgi:hypothetical protein
MLNSMAFLNAKIVVLVISSHDYADNPTFAPLNKNIHPTNKLVSALVEGVMRYLPRYLSRFDVGAAGKSVTEPKRLPAEGDEKEAQKALEDLRRFLDAAKNRSSSVLVFQYWEKSEINNGVANLGNQRIKEVCEQEGIAPISLAPYFRQAIEGGVNPYRDNIHPNDSGQQLISEAILVNLRSE